MRTDARVGRQLAAKSGFPLPFPVYADRQGAERHVWILRVKIRTIFHCTVSGRHAIQRSGHEKHDNQAQIMPVAAGVCFPPKQKVKAAPL